MFHILPDQLDMRESIAMVISKSKLKVMGRWFTKHRWTWEQHHGEIPKGMVVSFKNGIRTDCRIENLILLTRSELVRLNQSYIKYSTPETHESCILLAK